MFVDGAAVANGSGIQGYPTAAARSLHGFSIGSNRTGAEQAKGLLEELETFNYPLPPEVIAADYQAVAALDNDHDGLSDVQEHDNGTDPTNPDTDAEGLSDGDEVHVCGTDPLDPDTDYDGRSDWQEVELDGTHPLIGYDPSNELSVIRTHLARFTFDRPDFRGDRGQLPRQALNLAHAFSWSGSAVRLDAQQPANLKYADVEADGTANFNCLNGTINFWFQPNWTSQSLGGSGPGDTACLLELGDPTDPSGGWWAVSIDETGDILQFESQVNGNYTPHMAVPIAWSQGQWHMVTLAYTYWASGLYLDGLPVRSDVGTDVPVPRAARAASGQKFLEAIWRYYNLVDFAVTQRDARTATTVRLAFDEAETLVKGPQPERVREPLRRIARALAGLLEAAAQTRRDS